MLTAQENDHLKEGVGKAVNSAGNPLLQSLSGLRSRLQTYSIEDLVDAEAKVTTLVNHFEQLEQQLVNFTRLLQMLDKAETTINTHAPLTYDLDHPELTAQVSKQFKLILDAAKVVRFRRALEAARMQAAPQSLSLLPGHLQGILAKTIDAQRAFADTEQSPTDVSVAATPEAAPIPDEDETSTESTIGDEQQSNDHHSLTSETTVTEDLATAEPDIRAEFPPRDDSTELIPLAATATAAAVVPEFEDLLPATVDDSSNQLETTNQSKELVPFNEYYDQKLLNDLIENYGEFNANPNLPAPLDTEKTKKLKSEKSSSTHARQAESKSARLKSQQHKQGEVDRQLKKIVKDYGEVDLYSQKSTINYKTGVIAGAAILVLAVGGYYFFRTDSSLPTPTSSNAAVAQPAVQSSRPQSTDPSKAGTLAAPAAAPNDPTGDNPQTTVTKE